MGRGIEAAGCGTDPGDAPGTGWLGDAFENVLTQVGILEAATCKLARALADHHAVGLGQGLQPCRQVRRVAQRELLVSRPTPDVPHHHHTGVDTDTHR